MQFTATFGELITDPLQIFTSPLKSILDVIKYGDMMEDKIFYLRCYRHKMNKSEEDSDQFLHYEKLYKNVKKELPYFVASVFNYPGKRHTDFFKGSNGVILDIDHIGDPEAVKSFKNHIIKDEYVHFAFISPSGDGVKVGVMFDKFITDAKEYSKCYKYLSEQFSLAYGCKTDKTSDGVRACFLSYDPNLYYNPDSKQFPAYYSPQKVVEKKVYEETGQETFDKALRLAFESPAISDYIDWVSCGMGLKSEFYDSGLEIWLALSQNKGYKDNTQDLRIKYNSFSSEGGTNIGTYFEILKRYGVDISNKSN